MVLTSSTAHKHEAELVPVSALMDYPGVSITKNFFFVIDALEQ